MPHVLGGADGKASIERLCLSPYGETFNSKVIKGFIPELRSRECFSCFGIPMFYVYMLWTFYVRFTYPYHEYGTQVFVPYRKVERTKAQYSAHFVLMERSLLSWTYFLNLVYLVPHWICRYHITVHARHCWRSKDELVSDVLLWTPAYGQSKAGRPAWTYIQQLCDDMGCNPEDLPEAMNNRETWRERVKDIHASRTTWWWWLLASWNHIIVYELLILDRNT